MILEVAELEKRFFLHRLAREVVAFRGLSFQLAPGAFLLLAGPNGAGKSSLLRCLYRTYRPTAGRIRYRSLRGWLELAAAPDRLVLALRREELGYVSQFLDPRPRQTALEVVAEPLLWQGVEEPAARRRAAEMLEAVGLRPELWAAYPTTFSGGERQKVNLARSLIRPYRLLLLDEPSASLDQEARAALRAWLGRLKQEGTAMIGIFHHPEDVAGLVDATLFLEGPYVAEPSAPGTAG